MCASVHACMCVCVCVCVWKREREREREKERDRCVCIVWGVCLCVYGVSVYMCARVHHMGDHESRYPKFSKKYVEEIY